MFTVRPYKEEDAAACGDCFYEGFFSCSVDQNDKILLRDYAQILIEKCNFTYVAETEDHQVVGFICGKYDKHFSKALAAQYETKRHYSRWCKKFLKFFLKRYKMSAPFQKSRKKFKDLLARTPDIGGFTKKPLRICLSGGIVWMAVYKVMDGAMSHEQFGEIVTAMMQTPLIKKTFGSKIHLIWNIKKRKLRRIELQKQGGLGKWNM